MNKFYYIKTIKCHFQHTNTGAVYVFQNPKDASSDFTLVAVSQYTKHDTQTARLPILPREKTTTDTVIDYDRSRYGNALINLGDLNDDKYEDFAVGSPFEDGGKGAIYIYFGSQKFWKQNENGNYLNLRDLNVS